MAWDTHTLTHTQKYPPRYIQTKRWMDGRVCVAVDGCGHTHTHTHTAGRSAGRIHSVRLSCGLSFSPLSPSINVGKIVLQCIGTTKLSGCLSVCLSAGIPSDGKMAHWWLRNTPYAWRQPWVASHQAAPRAAKARQGKTRRVCIAERGKSALEAYIVTALPRQPPSQGQKGSRH